jgi:hypothetical protein
LTRIQQYKREAVIKVRRARTLVGPIDGLSERNAGTIRPGMPVAFMIIKMVLVSSVEILTTFFAKVLF